jgi:hypothetical protein
MTFLHKKLAMPLSPWGEAGVRGSLYPAIRPSSPPSPLQGEGVELPPDQWLDILSLQLRQAGRATVLEFVKNLICCFSDTDQVVKNCIRGFGTCEELIIPRN